MLTHRDHDVQRQVLATLFGGQLGNIPSPDLIWACGLQTRYWLRIRWPLLTALAAQVVCPQQAVHGTDRQ